MNNQFRLFEEGYKIVYRKVKENGNVYSEDSYNLGEEFEWRRLENDIKPQVK